MYTLSHTTTSPPPWQWHSELHACLIDSPTTKHSNLSKIPPTNKTLHSPNPNPTLTLRTRPWIISNLSNLVIICKAHWTALLHEFILSSFPPFSCGHITNKASPANLIISPPFLPIILIKSSIYLFKQNAKNSLPFLPFLLKDSDNFVKPEISANKETVFIGIVIGAFFFSDCFCSRIFFINMAGK